MRKRTWDELVAEGQELKVMEERVEAEAGNVRWLWGDLALEVAPMGADGPNNGALAELRRYAKELDVSFQSLRAYRATAAKWPRDMRVSREPWVVHQQIQGREDREELIANPVNRDGEKLDQWTFRAMQRFLGNKESPSYIPPPSSDEEKADLVLSLIEDPEVRAKVSERLGDGGVDNRGDFGERSFDDLCAAWVNRINSLMTQGAELANEGEKQHALSGHSAVMLAIYQNLVEREFDREIRRILTEETTS